MLKLVFDCESSEHMQSTSETGRNEEARLEARKINFVAGNEYANEFILCNRSEKELQIGPYLIPKQSSFQCNDVLRCLHTLKSQLSSQDVYVAEKFVIVIDPPWSGNKSVKRKNTYETSCDDDIVEMCRALSDIIVMLKNIQRRLHSKENLKIVIWTTNKMLPFVTDKMLPALQMQVETWLLWHKVTVYGESVKIRGGKEYVLICNTPQTDATDGTEGVILSTPSSIHSHKPPLPFDLIWYNETVEAEHFDFGTEPKICLIADKLCPGFKGLEIYARYLRPNFHSIGFECLKLQHVRIYE